MGCSTSALFRSTVAMRSSGKLAEFLAVCRRQEVASTVLVADNNATIISSSLTDLGFEVCVSIGKSFVDVMIVLAQAGFCVSYLIFIAITLVM